MSDPINIARHTLEKGNDYPYDAPDSWWASGDHTPPPPVDWAHAAARGVLYDLNDRHTIKRGFENIDDDTRKEIVDALAAIIREARP